MKRPSYLFLGLVIMVPSQAMAQAKVPAPAVRPSTPPSPRPPAGPSATAPTPRPAVTSVPSVEREETLRKTLEKRKAQAVIKAKSRSAARSEKAKQAERQHELDLRTEAQRQQLAIEAQKPQAIERLGAAAEQNAATIRARFGLERSRPASHRFSSPAWGWSPTRGLPRPTVSLPRALPVRLPYPPAVNTPRTPSLV